MKCAKPHLAVMEKEAGNTAAGTRRPKMILIVFGIIILSGASSVFGQTVTFSYESLNRLETVQYAGGAVFDYTYDNVGNRLTKGQSFGLNDVIAILKLLTGDPAGVFSSVDIDADGKIGMPELLYVMERLADRRD